MRNGKRWPLVLTAVGLLLSGASSLTAQGGGFFPYQVHKRTLANGLDVLVIPMPEFRNVLSYNTLILAGARNEIEPGKSGLAHLFEHIEFRHQWRSEPQGYERAIAEIGAFNNAWTWFDVTFYHPVTFASNLERLMALESDRFKALAFTEEIFKTEAGAVLGEYRNNASDPGLRMNEVLLDLMYGSHGYGHTTIGYLVDVEDMPNEYEAALDFYDTYYRPNNAILIIAGDVEPDAVFAMVERRYGDWQPKEIPDLPDPEPVAGPKEGHVDWGVPVPPRVTVSFRMPAYRTGSVETAVGQLLPELLASETAPLYKRLRYEEKLVQSMGLGKALYESFDDGRMDIATVLHKEKFEREGTAYLDLVVSEIQKGLDELKHFSDRPDAVELLTALKSKYRYDLLSSLNSPANVASTLALYYRFERDPDVLDRLVAGVEALSPEEIDRFAARYFVPQNRVVVTMSGLRQR